MKTMPNFILFLGLVLYPIPQVLSAPVAEMNTALRSLFELLPYLAEKESFTNKNHQSKISQDLKQLHQAFSHIRHDEMLKKDIFAPSYKLMQENLNDVEVAFNKGQKDYAFWRMSETLSHCLDCHSRLPISHLSNFKKGVATLPINANYNHYQKGILQLVARLYPEALTSFEAHLDESMKSQQKIDLTPSFKQIMLIHLKINRTPGKMLELIKSLPAKKEIPSGLKQELESWKTRLVFWSKQTMPLQYKSQQELKSFLKTYVYPIDKKPKGEGDQEVDHLIISGVLSHFLFQNPDTTIAPEINYWLGRSEKFLKADAFFGSGNLFFKQCIQRYPKDPYAVKCLKEYEESLEFEFSGSAGTNIPDELKKEIKELGLFIEKERAKTNKN